MVAGDGDAASDRLDRLTFVGQGTDASLRWRTVSMIESSNAAIIMAPDAESSEKIAWTTPVIEDFNSQIEGGSIGGASDVSVFHS
jgi:hypothetical protein